MARRLSFHRAYILSMAGLALYNNWLLGLIINPRAIWAGATSSELEVSGQPAYMLFRGLDIAAGFGLILGATAITVLADSRQSRWLLGCLVGVLGVSTIIETFIPLDCSDAISRQCAAHEQLGLLSWRNQFHIMESVFSYTLIAFLPLCVMFIVRHKESARRLVAISRLLLIFMVAWMIEAAIRLAHNATTYGYEQRLFFILFSCWYVLALQYAARRQLDQS